MRHHMDGPAPRPRLIRCAAGILRHRIEASADSGVGTKQFYRAELLLGLVDDVSDVFFLTDIASERRAADRIRNNFRAVAVEIGDDDLGCAFAMENLAQRLAYAIRAAGDDNDLARNFHEDGLGRNGRPGNQPVIKTRSSTAA